MSAARLSAALPSRPSPPPSPRVLGQSVRVALLGGELLEGSVELFSPGAPDFLLRSSSGADRFVNFESVKTVAFLSARGDRGPVAFQEQALLVILRLLDGDLVSGVTHSFGGPRLGLFLVPAGEPETERLYIPISTVHEVVAVERLSDVGLDIAAVTRQKLQRAAARRHLRAVEPPGESTRRQVPHRRRVDASPLGEILISHGSVRRAELAAVLAAQRLQPHRRLGELVVELGYTSSKMVGVALALQYGMPFLSLSGRALEPALRELVPAELARRLRVLPLARTGRRLRVAVEDPTAADVRHEVERSTGLEVEEAVVTPQEMERALAAFYENAPSRARSA